MRRLETLAMSRIDEGKPTSQLTPTADELQQRMGQSRVRSAATYSTKALENQRKTGALKGRGKPLGGAPPLDPEKMAAAMPRPAFSQEEPPPREVHEPPPEPSAKAAGVGAAYDVNQAFARGEVERPVSLREAENMAGARKTLSPESIEALKMAEVETEKESEPDISVSKPETKKKLEDSEQDLVDFPFEFGAMQSARSKLISDSRRKSIEERLDPLKIEDMVINRELLQTVPIVPGKLSVTLRTFNQREHLFCLRHVYKTGGSQLFIEELLNTCKLVCATFAINGAVLPEHRVNVGKREEEVDEDKFEEKMFHLSSFPVQLLADFSVQMIWFNNRVNKLLSLDNLKNG